MAEPARTGPGEGRWTILRCDCGLIEPADCPNEQCRYFNGDEVEVVPASQLEEALEALRAAELTVMDALASLDADAAVRLMDSRSYQDFNAALASLCGSGGGEGRDDDG